MPAYKKDFEPVAQIDEVIKIVPDNVFYRVKNIVPLPTFIHNFGSLGANATDTEAIDIVRSTVRIEMPKGFLAQFRLKVIDNFELIFRQPINTTRYTTVHTTFVVSPDTVQDNLTEFYQFENRSAGIIRRNPTGTALTSTRVMFYGFKFELEQVSPSPKYIPVPVGES